MAIDFSCSIAGESGTRAKGKWMGWERKRGKLHELNRLLRGATDTTFVADWRSPACRPRRRPLRDHARRRYATAARSRQAAGRQDGASAQPSALDPRCGRVVEGYAVLQPRVTPSLPTGREGSLFQRVFSSASGIDPYAFAVSDVYQDLFGEGSYSGKGNLRRRHSSKLRCTGAFPTTRCSVTTFSRESSRGPDWSPTSRWSRSFPSRYDVAAARQHRWARGDWQLLPWILGRGHGSSCDTGTGDSRRPNGNSTDRPLENDRQPAPHAVGAGHLPRIAGGMDARPCLRRDLDGLHSRDASRCPRLLPFFTGIVPRRLGISKRSHARAVGADLATGLRRRSRLLVTLLAHQAWLMTDAIVRTLFRLFVSHRRMLEWVTAAQAKLTTQLDLRGFYRRMAGGVALGAAAAVIVGVRRDTAPADRGSIRDPVDAVAGGRAMGESSAAIGRIQSALRRRRASAPADRAPHLALLRDLRHGGRSHASARQFPGGPEARARPSNVAHQPRTVPAVRDRRARFRLDRYARDRGAAGSDARHDEPSSSAFAAISTTGTTRAICVRWTRNTSLRSIAEISPDI